MLGTTYWKGREAGKEVIRAELQPMLTACEGREKALGTQIEAQNKAVDALKAEGDARVARATKGLARATQEAQGARSEAERLRVLARTPSGAECPAGSAVGEIRRGLK